MKEKFREIICMIENNLRCIDKPNIMEVCGTHTMALAKSGLRDLFKNKINFLSGPGCPVCVTHESYLDYVYELSFEKDIIIATYGDMIRVPGSNANISLEKAKAMGGNVKIVYSSMDALDLAKVNPKNNIVFLGIGFETTAPSTGVVINEAYENNISNFKVLSLHRRIKPIMTSLLKEEDLKIDAFLCPGHVAAVIGENGFKFLEDYEKVGVVAGFETEELLLALLRITTKLKNQESSLENCYKSIVKPEGNKVALEVIEKTFTPDTDCWRGIGEVQQGALKLKSNFKELNIETYYPIENFVKNYSKQPKGCSCGEVLKGKITPKECALFKKLCTPENPVGPCMVSQEGSCAAYYRYSYDI